MAVAQYRPTTELLAPLLEDVLRPLARTGSARALLRAPEADVVETEDGIRVMLDVPGMRPEEIEVDLENNVLTVSGERRPEWREGEDRSVWHLSERRYGRFSRSFVLPRDVDAERIEAHFEDGVLRVHVPKSERARRRHIQVQTGSGAGEAAAH